MPVASTTVTCALPLLWRAIRLAQSVPPTPPPRTTTSAVMSSPHLADHEAGVAALRDRLDQLLLGFGHPGGDVGLGAVVAAQDLEDLAHLALANRSDEVHQRPRAGQPARIDRLVDHHRAHFAKSSFSSSDEDDLAFL